MKWNYNTKIWVNFLALEQFHLNQIQFDKIETQPLMSNTKDDIKQI